MERIIILYKKNEITSTNMNGNGELVRQMNSSYDDVIAVRMYIHERIMYWWVE